MFAFARYFDLESMRAATYIALLILAWQMVEQFRAGSIFLSKRVLIFFGKSSQRISTISILLFEPNGELNAGFVWL